MKKHLRTILAILIIAIFLLNSFYLLPKESELYLKSDISSLTKSLMPISIIITILITFWRIFDRNDYKGNIWTKIYHLFYVGMMCIIIYPLISDFVLAVGLKLNRVSSNESINKNFIITFKHRSDSENLAYGRIPNRKYDGPIDKLVLNEKEFDLINEKQEIELKMQNGLFGIPFNPMMKK